jgi:glyoxylase-like metal-dependent hydrolase (beta-lactamase superfamily II)
VNPHASLLPPDITVLQRGWLSSNNVLLQGPQATALIDSGYCTHAPQTLALVRAALGGRALDVLVNTHLHSDHCGGNAALQAAWPALQTHIPPGLARHVRDWDPQALTYAPTGQSCPPFRYEAVLRPGTALPLGGRLWQVHAAPGHDTHSVILFEPQQRILVSADALWERGFGVVFPELEGEAAFAEVGQTLDLIASLAPAIVIPGHGAVFTDVAGALVRARERLDSFVAQPARHIRHAVRVLLKFKLLELQQIEQTDFIGWARTTPYLLQLHRQHIADAGFDAWIDTLIAELVRSGAAAVSGSRIDNVG